MSEGTKTFFIMSLLISAAVWSNHKMLEHLAGYETFRFFDLPREFRFVEVFFVASFFAYGLVAGVRHDGVRRFEHLKYPGLILTIGLAGGILNGVPWLDSLQGLYLFLSPLMVYYTSRWLDLGRRDLNRVRATMFWIIGLSVPAWIYQVLVYFVIDGNGDNVNGLVSDSHLFANITYSWAILAISRYYFERKFRWLAGGASLLLLGMMSVNEKSTVFLFLILPLLMVLVQERAKRWRAVRTSILIGTMVGLLLWGVGSVFEGGEGGGGVQVRTDVLLENRLEDIGTVIAYLQLPQVFAETPRAILVGTGAGNYGSAIAIRKQQEGLASSLSQRYVGDLELAGAVGAFAWQTNYFVGMLVEYGAVFTSLIVAFYLSFLRRNFSGVRESIEVSLKSWAMGISGMLMLMIMTALVSNISNFDEGLLSFPLMISAGALHNLIAKERRTRDTVRSVEAS